MMRAWIPRQRTQQIALGAGVLALLACLILGFFAPRQALLSYLAAFLFFLGLSLGSLAMLLVHAVSGGRWGIVLRPQLLAAARVLPLLAVLALPILIGVHVLYLWAQPTPLAVDETLRKQAWYLNVPFFVLRTVIYFALWCWLASAISRRLANVDPDSGRAAILPRFAGLALVAYALSMIFASTDWAMSLTPRWHSSTWGMMVTTGQMLGASALAVFVAVRDETLQPRLVHDLGNLMLMFVLGWSYLAFMQYLTVWIANLPTEIVWYIPRTLTSWKYVAWFLIAFHFAIPFVVLLSRAAKRRVAWLTAVAAALVVAHLVDSFWLVVPGFRPHGFAVHWTDPLAVIGVGGLWLSVYLGQWFVAPQVRDLREAAAHG